MPRGARLLLIAWCVFLAPVAWWTASAFRISADLRDFLPEPRTEAQRLLFQNIGESPASRLLLLSIEGDEPEKLAEISSALSSTLTDRREFAFVANGGGDGSDFPEEMLAYRYLITDAFDSMPLDSTRLSREITDRADDMTSPAAIMLEDILPRDPTLEMVRLAERWQPREQPTTRAGVWFSRDGERALLVASTRAAAFDPEGQARAIALIQGQFADARGDSPAGLRITGSGYFSATIKQQMQREATLFGAAATIGLVLLLWIAYRRPLLILVGALPLVTGVLAGLAAVGSLFESVHGITLAFGVTLLGVAQDYPVHLFSHLRHDRLPVDTARSLWRPLFTGVASTCIAYLAFLVSGVTGLAQLACLTITGLAVAAACTRFLLPRVITSPAQPVRSSRWLVSVNEKVTRAGSMRWLYLPILLVGALVLSLTGGPFWQDDLSRLTPIAPSALQFDARMRDDLRTPDLRYLLVVSAASGDEVLARLESLEEPLRGLKARGIIDGFEHAAQYLPSLATQTRRQLALPAPESLRDALDAAADSAGFAAGVFSPFLEDLERAREIPPLGLDRIAPSPLSERVNSLIYRREGSWHGLVSFHQIHDVAALAREAAEMPGAIFLDLKGASEELMKVQRRYILQCLAVAAAVLVLVVWWCLGSVRRTARVLIPMMLTTLVIVSVLRAFDVQLSLFHLISLMLAGGLGLDYALFFEHASHGSSTGESGQERTLHAVLICALSTLLVFALLASSDAPVLQAIGVTVSIGVIGNFLLALGLARGSAQS
jgi:predicted exporter